MKKRMKKRRNLTRFRNQPLMVRNLRVAKYWRRKLIIKTINIEFD
jgi:hypothetical protein